jgi:hypothetical protein
MKQAIRLPNVERTRLRIREPEKVSFFQYSVRTMRVS